MSRPVVCTPLRSEYLAVWGRLGQAVQRRTGRGPARSRAIAPDLSAHDAMLVAGLGGSLQPDVRPGDVVVASQVLDLTGSDRADGPASGPVGTSSALLAGALRRCGLNVHVGLLATSPTIVHGRARAGLAARGVMAVDMESSLLGAGFRDRPFAAVRAIVDAPQAPLLSPATIWRGIRGLGSLRKAAPALAQWVEAVGSREIVLASPRSFCAGVGRAIEIVERSLQKYGSPVYVRRQIVHNAQVVSGLEQRGAVFVEDVAEVPSGSVLVLAAHGVSPEVRSDAAKRDLTVVDATCPLVTKVHNEVRRYAARGDTIFLIGHRDHEEVEGTVGESPDQVIVVEDVEEAARVDPADPDRVAYVTQTTLAVDEAAAVADVLRQRFPRLSAPRRDDICYATTNRQLAVQTIAGETDLVLVVGSANSSNSRRLVEVSERSGTPAYLIDDANDVDLRWLAGVTRVGITAGASAPPHLVESLIDSLAGLGPVTVRDRHIVDEHVEFTLPREVS